MDKELIWYRNTATGGMWEVVKDCPAHQIIRKNDGFERIESPAGERPKTPEIPPETPPAKSEKLEKKLDKPIDEMEYKELQEAAKLLGLEPTGKKEVLAEAIKAKLAE